MNRSLYIAHGGGPLPLLGDSAHAEMVCELKEMASRIGKPSAIVVVSAHWEETHATITAGQNPELIYDYYGFPEAAYRIQYPAAGNPVLAEEVAGLMSQQGMQSRLDDRRGFDHGLFVPLKIMYPDADIPCIQISLLNSLNAEAHIRIGQALGQLPPQNLLLLGSGFSFHNMQAFFAPEDRDSRTNNVSFENWLEYVCCNKALTEAERIDRLCDWAKAPGARYCHPREEHLLPLHVCYGMAGTACQQRIGITILGKQTSMFYW